MSLLVDIPLETPLRPVDIRLVLGVHRMALLERTTRHEMADVAAFATRPTEELALVRRLPLVQATPSAKGGVKTPAVRHVAVVL